LTAVSQRGTKRDRTREQRKGRGFEGDVLLKRDGGGTKDLIKKESKTVEHKLCPHKKGGKGKKRKG